MSNLSDVQLANINDSCGNGFQLNARKYLMENKVEFIKYRDINDDTRLVYRLYYDIKYRKDKRYGSMGRLIRTNRFITVMKISTWKKCDLLELWFDTGKFELVTSYGLIVDRRSTKFLAKLTHKLNDITLDFLMNSN
ncbi:MAG: hypothetical protein ACRCTZ_17440 [Sarcina sp.]